MHLYFVRHGQSENNRLWSKTGGSDGRVPDPLLTPEGEAQAKLVAGFFAQAGSDALNADWDPQDVRGMRITHCYCSLMERAVATGHAIAESLNLPLRGWVDLHETGGMFLEDPETGVYAPRPGRSRGYLEATYPRIILPDEVTEAGWWNRPFEPQEARTPRARRVVAELMARHGGTDDGVIFVSHGGFFNHLLRVIFGLPDGTPTWFAANNASVTHLHFEDGKRTMLAYLNRVDFLPDALIT